MFMGLIFTWLYKLQNQFYLGSTEAEYIELSQSMRKLIGIIEVIKEIHTFVIPGKLRIQNISLTPRNLSLVIYLYHSSRKKMKLDLYCIQFQKCIHVVSTLPYHFTSVGSRPNQSKLRLS